MSIMSFFELSDGNVINSLHLVAFRYEFFCMKVFGFSKSQTNSTHSNEDTLGLKGFKVKVHEKLAFFISIDFQESLVLRKKLDMFRGSIAVIFSFKQK